MKSKNLYRAAKISAVLSIETAASFYVLYQSLAYRLEKIIASVVVSPLEILAEIAG